MVLFLTGQGPQGLTRTSKRFQGFLVIYFILFFKTKNLNGKCDKNVFVSVSCHENANIYVRFGLNNPQKNPTTQAPSHGKLIFVHT